MNQSGFWTAAGSEAPRRFRTQTVARKAVSPLRSATAASRRQHLSERRAFLWLGTARDGGFLHPPSGYGAGNHAPAYFEMAWNGFNEVGQASSLSTPEKTMGQRQAGSLSHFSLPTLFLTNVVRELRAAGTFRSTAEVIEAVRLAEAMADMKNSSPTLRELQDAAVTLLGQGDPAVVRESLLRIEVGTAIGALAKGVSQTSIQDDFYRELTRLKLDPFKAAVRRDS
jgi:Arc/MetJ-type ribon-helix-helix transcriptional regulator